MRPLNVLDSLPHTHSDERPGRVYTARKLIISKSDEYHVQK